MNNFDILFGIFPIISLLFYIAPVVFVIWFLLKLLKTQQEKNLILKNIVEKLEKLDKNNS